MTSSSPHQHETKLEHFLLKTNFCWIFPQGAPKIFHPHHSCHFYSRNIVHKRHERENLIRNSFLQSNVRELFKAGILEIFSIFLSQGKSKFSESQEFFVEFEIFVLSKEWRDRISHIVWGIFVLLDSNWGSLNHNMGFPTERTKHKCTSKLFFLFSRLSANISRSSRGNLNLKISLSRYRNRFYYKKTREYHQVYGEKSSRRCVCVSNPEWSNMAW